jgi:PAS domain S-box-containing protein
LAKPTEYKSTNIYHGEGEAGSVFIDRTELFCIFQPDLSLTYVNPSCCQHVGKTLEAFKDKSFLIFVLEEDRSVFQQKLKRLKHEYPVLTYECNVTNNNNGESIWYRWTIRSIFSKEGGLMEYQAIGRDITQHRQVEKIFLETKKRYEAVVEDQMELVCRYLPDCTLTFVNRAYCQYHGKKRHELIGTSFLPTIGSDDRDKLFQFLKSTNPQHPTQNQIQQITTRNGETLWVEWRRRALFDDSGNLIEIQSVGRDITELTDAQEAMRQKTKELERKNTALTEVLEQIEQQKQQIKNDVITNVDDLLIPILEQFMSKGSKLDSQYLSLIKRSLEDLTSSFGRKITEKSLKLTPREIQICNMVKRGLTSKDIANLLNLSLNTVGRHRHSIRKKAKIIDKKENLYIYLQSF